MVFSYSICGEIKFFGLFHENYCHTRSRLPVSSYIFNLYKVYNYNCPLSCTWFCFAAKLPSSVWILMIMGIKEDTKSGPLFTLSQFWCNHGITPRAKYAEGINKFQIFYLNQIIQYLRVLHIYPVFVLKFRNQNYTIFDCTHISNEEEMFLFLPLI